jgi:hypothetical protein
MPFRPEAAVAGLGAQDAEVFVDNFGSQQFGGGAAGDEAHLSGQELGLGEGQGLAGASGKV